MKYLLNLAYNGANYHGWQKQATTTDTVQEIIERSISLISQQNLVLIGCGRTDKGVHAQQYFANFTYSGDVSLWVNKLNKLLPSDIVIYQCVPIDSNFNARFAAKSRTYRYYFHSNKNPLIKGISSYYDLAKADFNLLDQALNILGNFDDFKAFCKTPLKHDSTICKIYATRFYTNPSLNRFCIEISANRFLRGMMRIIVFRLLEVAKGNLSLRVFEELLKTGELKKEIQFAYPQGLFLTEILYSGFSFQTDHHLDDFLFKDLSLFSAF